MVSFVCVRYQKRDLYVKKVWAQFIIAPRIDFDDHKLFEETTNMFLIFGDYFYDISGSPRG